MIVAGTGSGNQDYNQIMKSILTSISYMQLVHLMCMHDKLTVTSKTSFDFSICEKLINGYKWPQHRRDTLVEWLDMRYVISRARGHSVIMIVS